MNTVSKLPQDLDSIHQLTKREQRAELAVARAIVREALAIAGMDEAVADTVTITMSTRLTSTMGKARYADQSIRLSASALWRRASPEKRRNTTVHELAHLVVHRRYPNASGHGREWKAVMSSMGETPKRCHSVPTIPTQRRKRRRPTHADFLAEVLGSAANASAVTTGRVTHRASFRVGDVVMFGRSRGEQTRAEVERVNRKTLSLVTLEPRAGGRYPKGSKFRASFALVRK